MTEPVVNDLRQLVSDVIIPFYQVQRATPLHFAIEGHEDDAQHSWSLALLACALAPQLDPSLDIGRVAQYAVVHDLVEIYAGDTSNHAPASEKATKAVREAAAQQRLQRELTAFPWITNTLQSYEAQADTESVFVRSVDKLLPLLFDLIEEGLLYRQERISQAEWRSNLQQHRAKASRHSGVFGYYQQIWAELESHPEYFHQA